MGDDMTNQAIEEFKTQVLILLDAIPAGQIISYGELARQAGRSGYARQVGYLLKNLPNDTRLPWHRVVNSQGKISFNEGSDAFMKQKILLEKEGWKLVKSTLIREKQ